MSYVKENNIILHGGFYGSIHGQKELRYQLVLGALQKVYGISESDGHIYLQSRAGRHLAWAINDLVENYGSTFPAAVARALHPKYKSVVMGDLAQCKAELEAEAA